MKRNTLKGFTMIELIVVIAIVAILVSLAIPKYSSFLDRAQSVACMNNLRQLGIGVLGYVGDNDNTYPLIEPNPQNPVYEQGVNATPLKEFAAEYGMTDALLKCPADIRRHNYFKQGGSSYQWRITLDDENFVAPKIYGGRRGGIRVVSPRRVTICTDYEAVHFGRLNRLYADGHVVAKLN